MTEIREEPIAMLDIDVSERDGATICQLSGDLDAITVSRFRQALPGCLRRPGVVIDLSELRFIDGAGLTALVGSVRRARDESCKVAVSCARTSLRQVFASAGLDRIVLVLPLTVDALAAVSASDPLGLPTTPRAGRAGSIVPAASGAGASSVGWHHAGAKRVA
jgi:anti-anti-sigma factor